MVGAALDSVPEIPSDVEALLSRHGGFVLCDAKVCPKVNGLPIRYASQQFQDMLGYKDASECVGQAWSDVLTGPSGFCTNAAQAAQLPSYAVTEAVELLSKQCKETVKKLANATPSSASMLALARRSSGELFTCELTLWVRQHPSMGWNYVVGLHRDITQKVPVARLLTIAAKLSSQGASTEELAAAVGVDLGSERTERNSGVLNGTNIPDFLNAKICETWQSLIVDMMRGEQKDKTSRRSATRSVVSGSTAASRSSRASRRSTASADNDNDWDWEASTALQQEQAPSMGCHLGALLGQQTKEAPPADGRFMDLLEDLDPEDLPDQPQEEASAANLWAQCSVDRAADLLAPALAQDLASRGPAALGPISDTLQEVIDEMGKSELQDLDFPFVMADPSQLGCPLIVCSAGFTNLTGYSAWEAVGRTAAFQLCGVPSHLVCKEQCGEVTKFLDYASRGQFYEGRDHLGKEAGYLTEGELITVQTYTRRSGELFRCMTYLKQVELEDKMFVIGLQARVPDPAIDPEEHDGEAAEENPAARLSLAFTHLDKNMDIAVHVLGAQFWYCAPMRRQIAVGSDFDDEREW